jgi:hypothetical protein
MIVSNLGLEANLHRKSGSGKQERFTYDFVIDGKSLADTLQVHNFDSVGCLDVLNQKWNIKRAKILLLSAPADIAPNRCMLYVCPECGDLVCGAFTAEVTKREGRYIWSNFRYENDCDVSIMHEYPHIGPFGFAAAEYDSLLAGFDLP